MQHAQRRRNVAGQVLLKIRVYLLLLHWLEAIYLPKAWLA